MEHLIIVIPGITFLGFCVSMFIPAKNEKAISATAFITTGIGLLFAIGFTTLWIIKGAEPINVNEITLFASDHYDFFIDLYFDEVSAVYLLVSSLLAYLIAIYSRYYLHREPGYKRFFNTKLLFVLGIKTIILSGNFETLFLGWEVLGVSSFLLIAFYRERYLPVRNALKVYSIYRVADVGLLLAMWLSHHLWHQNITFSQLNDPISVHSHLGEHYGIGLVISIAIVLAAAAKSAQFPFSSWLPRAMEGPTPSSAIFYGSVAVHIGVFLLLRTFPFWEGQLEVRILVFALGAITLMVGATSARVQTSVKAQIAYSSITQIGLIFMEVALGLKIVALVHLSGNAFLRAYQLLVSPSVVTYLIRERFFHYKPIRYKRDNGWRSVVRNSLFVLGLKEWKLDSLLFHYLWQPLKKIGGWFSFLHVKNVLIASVLGFTLSILVIEEVVVLPQELMDVIPEIFGGIAFMLVARSFTERKNPLFAWELLVLSHFWVAFGVGFNEDFNVVDTLFYLGGVVIAGAAGYYLLHRLKRKERLGLNDFYGYGQKHDVLSLAFLLSCLALAGFPITTTFLGEDLLFTHIQEDQYVLATFVAIIFIVEGLSLMRLYARIFLGPYKTIHQPVPLRDA